ncbi:MAG: hypothetical protein HW383_814, partial [Candidatus Magasanikbacteria bacterium]|nr:hypothetical protein [Candidatus Magasanikbacteria bacterium]
GRDEILIHGLVVRMTDMSITLKTLTENFK